METSRAPSAAVEHVHKTGWTHRVAFLLFGVLFVLLLLIGAWALRTGMPAIGSIVVGSIEEVGPSPEPVAAVVADPTPVLKASLNDMQGTEGQLSAQLASLTADLAKKQEACRVVEASPPKPLPPPKPQPPPKPPPPPPQKAEAPPPPPPPPQPLPEDRWAAKDLGVLQGCWNLGQEAPTVMNRSGATNRQENCVTQVGRICFDGNGHGTREQTISCPIAGTMSCQAPVTGKFAADGTFRTTQPDVTCRGGSGATWVGRTLTCQRVDGGNASCRDDGRPDQGFPAQNQAFRRAP